MASAYSSLVVKDETTRLVEGFANVEVLDRQSDIVPTGAMFKAMLGYMERGGIILLGHENKPVGKVVQWSVEKLASGVEGIHIIASIHTGTGLGDAAWAMLKDKQITGFSIGGVATETTRFKDKSAAGGVARELSEIELNEISLVQIPANPLAMVEQLSMAKKMDEDGRVVEIVEKESNKYASSKREAQAAAQKLEHEGKVVRRIYQSAPEGAQSWCVEWQEKVNYSNDQGSREEIHPKPTKGDAHPSKIEEHDIPKQRVLMALKSAGLVLKSKESLSTLMSVLPLIVDIEGKPEEKAEDAPESMKLDVDPNTSYDSTKYTGSPKAGDVGGSINSASPGAAHAVYSPMSVRDKAQTEWIGKNRSDLLQTKKSEMHVHPECSACHLGGLKCKEGCEMCSQEGLPKPEVHEHETEKGGDDKRPNEDLVKPDQHDNDSEKVSGPDSFDRTDPIVDEKYHGDGTFVDQRVVDVGKQCEICESVSMFKTHDDHEVCLTCANLHAKSPYPFTQKSPRLPNDESTSTGGNNMGIDGEQVTASVDSMKKPGPMGNEKRETAARHAKMKKFILALVKENIPSSQASAGGAVQGGEKRNEMQPFENIERARHSKEYEMHQQGHEIDPTTKSVRKLLIELEKKRKSMIPVLT